MACQLWHDLDGVRLDEELSMVGSEVLCDQPCVAKLIERGIRETDRERLDRLHHLVCHRRDYSTCTSIPPERKAPSGTSLMRRRPVASFSSPQRLCSNSATGTSVSFCE